MKIGISRELLIITFEEKTMNYFISDTHFGHSSVMKHGRAQRFSDVHEMNNVITSNWNDSVTDDDVVYIIGDFWYKGSVPATVFLSKLNGKKVMLRGNHDHFWIKNEPEAMIYLESVERYYYLFEEGSSYTMFHYPLLDWRGGKSGSNYMIHGHLHHSEYITRSGHYYEICKATPNMLNACVEINDYRPVTLEQLIENNNAFYRRDP
jgi:calcineurin-like phosphoesterase family protein